MYKITLDKHGASWHWYTKNPVGGGFGSNYCGPKTIALKAAIRNIPIGAQYEIWTNGKHTGTEIKT